MLTDQRLTKLNHKVTDQQLTELIFGLAMPTYAQNTLKIGKKHRILATSFSNLGGGGSNDPVFKSAGVRTPRPPRRRRPCYRGVRDLPDDDL